jgi:hypothetical protein
MKKKLEFKKFDHCPISEIKTMGGDNTEVKFIAYLGEMEEANFEKDSKGNFKLTATVTLVDELGNSIESLSISKTRYHNFEKRLFTGEPMEIIGIVVKEELPRKRKTDPPKSVNKIKILRTRTADKPVRLVQISKSERAYVKKYINNIKRNFTPNNRWHLFEALKETCIEKFGIVGVNKNSRYSDTLNAMIVQAYSRGKIGNANGKIHVGVIGPPSSGKKLFFETAKLLNFIYQEAHSGTLSIPGIAGSCVQKNGSWMVEKGLIPLAHNGVFGIQDLDKSSNKPLIFETIGPVMEDGICIVGKAGKRIFPAETAIYYDVNKTSDLGIDYSNLNNVLADTGIPTFIFSRTDYICEFPTDAKIQFANATDSFRNGTDTNYDRKDRIFIFCESNSLDYERFLKLLNAYITGTYSDIDVNPVLPIISKKFNALVKINRKNLHQLDIFALFLMRMKNTILKMVIALTRLQLLRTSNKAAVDMTFHLLSRKLEFLQNIDPALLVPKYRKSKANLTAEWIFKTFGDKTFSIGEAFKKYKKDDYPVGKIEIRQLRNRIGKKMYDDKGHNKWRLKPSYIKKFKIRVK